LVKAEDQRRFHQIQNSKQNSCQIKGIMTKSMIFGHESAAMLGDKREHLLPLSAHAFPFCFFPTNTSFLRGNKEQLGREGFLV